MMRILHFSDIHCGIIPKGWRWLMDKRLLGTLTHQLRRKKHQDWSTIPKLVALAQQLQPDVIVCTGDLCSVSNPEEFHAACQLLHPLTQLRPHNFIYLPGNHDAYVKHPEAINAKNQTVSVLNNLRRPDGSLPLARSCGHLQFLLLDAARPMPPWRSGGHATIAQHAKMLRHLVKQRRLHSSKVNILVSHFPLFTATGAPLGWRRGLTHDQLFRSLAADNFVKLILCGHIHTPFLHDHLGCLQVCPGSLTLHRHCAVIDVHADTQQTTAKLVNLNLENPLQELT